MKKVQKANANSSVKNLISPAKQDKRHACILIKRAVAKVRKGVKEMLRKIFHVNDGLDGVALAKSRRQVIHIIAKEYGYHKRVITRQENIHHCYKWQVLLWFSGGEHIFRLVETPLM